MLSDSMQTAQLHFNERPVAGFDELVDCYGAHEFESPRRSTVPLLAFLRDGWPQFQRLLSDCGLCGDIQLHLEWQVMPVKGMGKASHTDVMAKTNGAALAIEAKWTEPRYKTVAAWLGKDGGSPNQRAVLDGWIDLLRPRTKKALRAAEFSGTVYQMVHRAASACAGCWESRPSLAYVQFSLPQFARTRPSWIKRDLADFRELLGLTSQFPFYFIEIEIEPTVHFRSIESLRKGVPETGVAVREALRGAPLFEFGEIYAHQIPATR